MMYDFCFMFSLFCFLFLIYDFCVMLPAFCFSAFCFMLYVFCVRLDGFCFLCSGLCVCFMLSGYASVLIVLFRCVLLWCGVLCCISFGWCDLYVVYCCCVFCVVCVCV